MISPPNLTSVQAVLRSSSTGKTCFWENSQDASSKLRIKKVVPFPTSSSLKKHCYGLWSNLQGKVSLIYDLAIRIFKLSRGTYEWYGCQSRALLSLQFRSMKLLNTKWALSWLNLFTSFNQSIKQVSLEAVKAESRVDATEIIFFPALITADRKTWKQWSDTRN